jgi:hypothetical protein
VIVQVEEPSGKHSPKEVKSSGSSPHACHGSHGEHSPPL